jgi:hypothetical protein
MDPTVPSCIQTNIDIPIYFPKADTCLSNLQQEAIDLYLRGLNVFPVLRPEIVRSLAEHFPDSYSHTDKLPYILKPLFITRLHLCNSFCAEIERKTGRPCIGSKPGLKFEDLFDYTNLAIMTGRTSGNLIHIDCDTQKAFKSIISEFSQRNLPYWAYSSARGGGILLRTYEGEVSNLNNVPGYPNVQVWGNNHFCVVPPSVHASGVVYTWLDRTHPRLHLPAYEPPPTLKVEHLAWLSVKLINKQYKCIELFGLPDWTKHLSNNNREILANGALEGERNAQLTKTAYDIAAIITLDLVDYKKGELLLLDAANKCHPPYPIKDTMRILKSAIRKQNLKPAKEYFKAESNNYNKESKEKPRAFLHLYNWASHGRTALTDQAVYEACIIRSDASKTHSFRASQREIAEIANIQDHRTAGRSLSRLVSKKILSFSPKDEFSTTCFAFGEKVMCPDLPINYSLNSSGEFRTHQETTIYSPEISINKDIFSKLGRIAWLVWNSLLCTPESNQAVIARNVHRNRSCVHKAITKLKELGLISWSTAEGLFIGENLSYDQLELIAAKLNVLGRSHQRHFRFQRERELYANRQLMYKKKKIIQKLRKLT